MKYSLSNTGISTLIFDADIAKKLSVDFIESSASCKALDYDSFKNRAIQIKILEGCAKIFSPLL